MKILKVFFKIIFIVAFILSLGLNVVFAISSTNRLIFKGEDKDILLQLLYNAQNELLIIDDRSFVLELEQTEDGAIVKYKYDLSCEKNEEASELKYKCTQIATVYNEDNSVKRISYFPGDDTRYVEQGETKSKEEYTNESLATFFKEMNNSGISSLSQGLDMLFNGPDREESEISIDTSVRFDFKTFSLIKEVELIEKAPNGTLKLSYTFDGKDRLTSFTQYANILGTEHFQTLKIKYSSINHSFPNLENYSSATEGDE